MKTDIIKIETPEKIIFTYKLAGLGSRIGAFLADTFLQIIAIFIIFLAVKTNNPDFSFGYYTARDYFFISFAYLVYFSLMWGYFVFFEVAWRGQSPGKKMFGIRVIKSTGESMDLYTIILRNLVRCIDNLPLLCLLGGVIAMIDKRSRRLGDLVSDTLVVYNIKLNIKEPEFKTILKETGRGDRLGNVNIRLNENQLYILRRFLNEKDKLPENKRKEITLKLSAKLKKLLNIKVSMDPVRFIEIIYRSNADEDEK